MTIDLLSIVENNSFIEMSTDKKQAEGYSEFFCQLKARIKNGGLTQRKVAISLGMSESWLSKIVNGHRNMDVSDLYRIAQLLGISPAALLSTDKGSPRANSNEEIIDQLYKILPNKIREGLIKKSQDNKQEG